MVLPGYWMSCSYQRFEIDICKFSGQCGVLAGWLPENEVLKWYVLSVLARAVVCISLSIPCTAVQLAFLQQCGWPIPSGTNMCDAQ